MIQRVNRQWLLVRRPQGIPQLGDYEKVTGVVPEPGAGQVLVQVLYATMDPAIRGFMNAGGNYASRIPMGDHVKGFILGKIVRSNTPSTREGEIVFGIGAWSDFVVGAPQQFHTVPVNLGYELPAYTHVLGTIGLTGLYGLIDIAKIAAGDCVLVSSAAGPVRSLVGHMAKIQGAAPRVRLAGGADKCPQDVARQCSDPCF